MGKSEIEYGPYARLPVPCVLNSQLDQETTDDTRGASNGCFRLFKAECSTVSIQYSNDNYNTAEKQDYWKPQIHTSDLWESHMWESHLRHS